MGGVSWPSMTGVTSLLSPYVCQVKSDILLKWSGKDKFQRKLNKSETLCVWCYLVDTGGNCC